MTNFRILIPPESKGFLVFWPEMVSKNLHGDTCSTKAIFFRFKFKKKHFSTNQNSIHCSEKNHLKNRISKIVKVKHTKQISQIFLFVREYIYCLL